MKRIFIQATRPVCCFVLLLISPLLFSCSQDLQSITLSPANPVLGPNGMATAVSPGATTVTAAYGPIFATTGLTIGTTTGVMISVSAPDNPTSSSAPTIPIGLKQQFIATASYLSDNTQQEITSMVAWSSTNTSVATIDSISGLATAVASGTTTITAAYGSLSASVALIVSPSSVTLASISVTAPGNPTNISAPVIPRGLNQQFSATGAYTDGHSYDLTFSATWSSSNTTVAMVNSTNGLATSVGTSSAMISASFGGQSSIPVQLTVINAALNMISVSAPGNPASVVAPAIPKGLSQPLTATGTFADGKNYDISPYVIWGSNTPLQVFVNSTGLATAAGAPNSSSLIVASYNGMSGNIIVTISPVVLETITISPLNPSISNGLSQKFIATGIFSDGSRSDITTLVTWSLGAPIPPVATISNSFYQQMAANGTYNGGSGDISSMVAWDTRDHSVAVVSPYGLVSAVGPGVTTISADNQGISASTTVTVFTPILKFIRVTPQNPASSLSLNGTALQFTATGYYSDGTTRDITGIVTWSTDQPGIALFNTPVPGLATAAGSGTTFVTAQAGTTISANTMLVVTP